MEDTYERHNAVAVVTAVGEYDADTVGPIDEQLTAAAASHPTVVLDASALTFADSSFLNLLIRVHRTTTLRIAAPQNRLRRLLEMTGADQVLDVRATLKEATRP
ncbi:STAS domain-containing protein [Streptomyces sp. NPDC001568]|uniref:STAS domain-containing protein n=1 Tax=Streptomyces sp. NPDC001568 TaxID=3364588 RepID=UPI0036772B99